MTRHQQLAALHRAAHSALPLGALVVPTTIPAPSSLQPAATARNPARPRARLTQPALNEPTHSNPVQPAATPCNRMQPDATTPNSAKRTQLTPARPASPPTISDLRPPNPPARLVTPATGCNPVQPPATAPAPAQNEPTADRPFIPPHSLLITPSPLSPRHLAACRLLLAGHSLPAAAAQLGVSRQTLWRWSRRPAFTAELLRLHESLATGVDSSPEQSHDPIPLPTPPPATQRSGLRSIASIFREFGFEPPSAYRDR